MSGIRIKPTQNGFIVQEVVDGELKSWSFEKAITLSKFVGRWSRKVAVSRKLE